MVRNWQRKTNLNFRRIPTEKNMKCTFMQKIRINVGEKKVHICEKWVRVWMLLLELVGNRSSVVVINSHFSIYTHSWVPFISLCCQPHRKLVGICRLYYGTSHGLQWWRPARICWMNIRTRPFNLHAQVFFFLNSLCIRFSMFYGFSFAREKSSLDLITIMTKVKYLIMATNAKPQLHLWNSFTQHTAFGFYGSSHFSQQIQWLGVQNQEKHTQNDIVHAQQWWRKC